MISIQLMSNVDSNKWWLDITKLFLYNNFGNRFSIHCWKEEQMLTDLAKKYGAIEQSEWQYGNIISGRITDDFANFIITVSFNSKQNGQKMTPFFNIVLGDNFFSSHYGQEVHLDCEEEQLQKVQTIMNPLLRQGKVIKFQSKK